MRFSSPPGWPTPPADWSPEVGWRPQPDWPAAPDDWSFWTDDEGRPVDGPWVPEHHEASEFDTPSSLALWAFTAVQVVLILVEILLLRSGTPSTGGILAVGSVLNVACLVADLTLLRQAGYRVPVYLYICGLLVVPLYLIFRIRLTRTGWWPLVGWIGALVVSVLATPLVAYVGGVELEAADVESSIEGSYSTGEGTSLVETSLPVQATCPDPLVVRVGETFDCETGVVGEAPETVTVTLESWLGEMSWRRPTR
ncbi:DUF4333 domain-containing protein [Promicromonospora sp. NPDC060204]|uniref:DUF4333 domain-containing protein n=1 Tax=Promicromonospora sp. NPDC060204 TaxID=3347071 RepID=UPI00365AA8A9